MDSGGDLDSFIASDDDLAGEGWEDSDAEGGGGGSGEEGEGDWRAALREAIGGCVLCAVLLLLLLCTCACCCSSWTCCHCGAPIAHAPPCCFYPIALPHLPTFTPKPSQLQLRPL